MGPNLNWEIDLSPYILAATVESPHHHGAQPHARRIKRQLIQCCFWHDVEGRAIVNEHFGHYVVQAFDEHVQGFVVSPAFDWYLLVGKGKVILANDVIDYALEALH